MNALLVALGLLVPSLQAPAPPEDSWLLRRGHAAPWALVGVRIVDPALGTVSAERNVIVRGDRIESVTEELPPADMEALDGEGAFVLPGLVDLHAHVMAPSRFRPEAPPPEETLERLLRAGVTTIRLLPLFSEHAQRWRAEVNAGRLVGPTIVPASGVFEREPQRTSVGFRDPATAAEWVRKEALLGSRWIKVYNAMDAASLAAIVETARANGMEVCGHANGVLPREAVEIGQRTLEHIVDFPVSCLAEGVARPSGGVVRRTGAAWAHYDPARGESLMRLMVERGAAWVPTLVVTERILRGGSDDGSSESPEDLEALDAAITRAAREALRLHRMGGLVGLGTDFPIDGVVPGESVWRELELLVERGGATPAEALTIATRSSVRILGLGDLLGSVEPGKLAHFLVFSANPLEDLKYRASLQWIVHDGRRHAPE